MSHFDERALGTFVAARVPQFEQLNGANERCRNVAYLQILRDGIRQEVLEHTEDSGDFISLLKMRDNHEVAIKKLKKSDHTEFIVERLEKYVSRKELEELLQNDEYILFMPRRRSLQSCTKREAELLYLAWEHKKFTELLPEYVLPSYFVTYPLSYDILMRFEGASIHMIEKHKNYRGDGLFVTDKPGKSAQLMVQPFLADIKKPLEHLYRFNVEDTKAKMSSHERMAIRELLDEVWNIYKETGWLLSDNLKNNIGFTSQGRLVLFDTNNLTPMKDVPENQKEVILERFALLRAAVSE